MNEVCVSIEATTPAKFLYQLEKLGEEHDFFELRLDSLDTCNLDTIESLLAKVSIPIIATLRSKSEGGKFAGSFEEQAQLVRACLKSKASYCDIELSLLEQFPDLLKGTTPERLIISYHNFQATPDDDELQKIIKQMKAVAPKSIYKISCMAKDTNDVVRLTELQKTFEPRRAVIVAMGEPGQILRLLGPSLGAFTSFASANEQPVAPGQLYYRKMKDLMIAMETSDGGQ